MKKGKRVKKKNMFRTAGKSRASKANPKLPPKPMKHEPNPKEAKGCGNPICTVIDRKARRFSSICSYIKFACVNSRKNQFNFIQKGDCYDIIDKKDGAKNKPWTPKDLDLSDCSACAKDQYCGQTITINIDLMNVISGKSSAFGGPIFNEQSKTNGRMVGIPIEFPNVCEFMKWAKSKENVNLRTQVVGVGVGKKTDLVPTDKNSNKCLWTEWFDHNTPCKSTGDKEQHTEHKDYLKETYTGSLRICMPQEFGSSRPQHVGGSELTQVPAQVAKDGQAMGTEGDPFKQILHLEELKVVCKDTEQVIPKLPAPYIYGEGVEGKVKKNATCLDYKARYCCKGNRLYRPTAVSEFSNFMGPKICIGPTFGEVKTSTDGKLKEIKLTNFPITGQTQTPGSILIKPTTENFATADIRVDNKDGMQLGATFTIKKTKDGAMKIDVKLRKPSTINKETGKQEKPIDGEGGVLAVITLHVKSDGQVETVEINSRGLKSVSNIKETKDQGGSSNDKYTPDDACSKKEDREKMITTTITDKKGGKQVIKVLKCGRQISSTGSVQLNPGKNFWQRVEALTTELNVEYFIESPPLATIFAECRWKDWVDVNYPDKFRQSKEWELRREAYDNKKFNRHVCGKDPINAHYVDAVTRETQTPWYELKANKKSKKEYEVYKLTPFAGYICNDANHPEFKRYCQDMKVRYCCAVTLRAQWSQWHDWSECSRTCGGGKQVRIKTCQQISVRSKNSYNTYIDTCVGQESPAALKQASEQTRSCNVEGCEVPYQWASWSAWSLCSVTCDIGTKTRERICSPAKDGGEPCPDKRKEKDLYYQTENCTMPECETFLESQWTAWSGCSVTCGIGKVFRERHCMSKITLNKVDNKKCNPCPDHQCATKKDHFKQSQQCHLQSCPIDGNWGGWLKWGPCSQNCVDHPDIAKEKTKAKRERRRYCDSPHAAFKGKPCKKEKKYKWISHENGQMEETECITELSKDKKPGEKVTPWCPVNCILSQWSAWSACSQTCVLGKDGDKVLYTGYDANGHPTKRYSKAIEMTRPTPPGTLPKRSRYKTTIQKAKYGGNCPKEKYWSTNPNSPPGTFFQFEECQICPEHMPNVKNKKKLVDWPALKYPHHKIDNCVGFCKISCQWKKPTTSVDCKVEQEEYFKTSPSKCFYSELLAVLGGAMMKDEYKALNKHILDSIKKLQETKDEKAFEAAIKEDGIRKLPEIKKVYEEEEYDDVKKGLDAALHADRHKLIELLKSSQERWAEVPVLDGLYGGKPCVMKNGKQLTVRDDEDPKFDKNKMDNGRPREKLWSRYDMCDIYLCPYKFQGEDQTPGTEVKCEIFQWAEWGDWGKCDLSCGDEGKRKRKRKCVNTCDDKVAEGDDIKKCRPFKNWEDKELTDTDTTVCSPCPTESKPHFSEWSDWTWEGGKMCGDGKGKMVRKRKCIEVDGKKDCKGESKDEREVPMPPCKEGDKWYTGGKGYKQAQSYTEGNGGSESAGSEDEGKSEDKSEDQDNNENDKKDNDEQKEENKEGYNEDDE